VLPQRTVGRHLRYPALMTCLTHTLTLALLGLTLTGCGTPAKTTTLSAACAAHEASYECQVERYHNISVP